MLDDSNARAVRQQCSKQLYKCCMHRLPGHCSTADCPCRCEAVSECGGCGCTPT